MLGFQPGFELEKTAAFEAFHRKSLKKRARCTDRQAPIDFFARDDNLLTRDRGHY